MNKPLMAWIEQAGSQKAAAAQIGVAQSLISQILSGHRRITPRIAERIERASGGAVRKERLIWPEDHT